MSRILVVLLVVVVDVIAWITLRTTGILYTINHVAALGLGAVTTYGTALLGWKIVNVYQKKRKSKRA